MTKMRPEIATPRRFLVDFWGLAFPFEFVESKNTRYEIINSFKSLFLFVKKHIFASFSSHIKTNTWPGIRYDSKI